MYNGSKGPPVETSPMNPEMYNGSKGPPVETSPMNPEMYNGSKGPPVKKDPMNQEMYNCERTELACFRPKRPSLNPTLDKNQSI